MKKTTKKKICVLGGAGFLGSHIVDRLIAEDHKVVVMDNLSSGKRENVNKEADFGKADILNYSELLTCMNGCDTVFHLAAIPRVRYSEEHPMETHEANVTGTLNVLLAAKEAGIKKIVFASTSAIYGDMGKDRYEQIPQSPYAIQKKLCEEYMMFYSRKFEIPIYALRIFNAYGTRCNPDSEYSLVIPKFIKKIKAGETIEIYGNGNQSRDFVHVSDIADAFVKCMNHNNKETEYWYNNIDIGTGKDTSINQLISILSNELGEIKIKFVEPKPCEARRTIADLHPAQVVIRWKPKKLLIDGIKEMIQ